MDKKFLGNYSSLVLLEDTRQKRSHLITQDNSHVLKKACWTFTMTLKI